MNWSNSKVRFRDTSRLVFQELQERHLVGRNSMVGLLNIATFIEEKRISVGLWPFYPKVSNWMELVFWKLMSDIWVLPLQTLGWRFSSLQLDRVFFLKFSMRSFESSCDIWVLPLQTCTVGCRKWLEEHFLMNLIWQGYTYESVLKHSFLIWDDHFIMFN